MDLNALMLNGLPHEEEAPEDDNEDIHFDVDDMSDEELLGLEEPVGDVSIGLPEVTIFEHLTRQIYQPFIAWPGELESCCICQEDYVDGDELGKMHCGHQYHFNCIKQWLTQKNSCPICKKSALHF